MASYLFVSFLTAEWHVVDNFLILSQKPEARSQKPEASRRRQGFGGREKPEASKRKGA
jgi:hypothetical protein